VQRLEVVMRPEIGPIRLCVIGRKRLPDIDDHETNWGFVEAVSISPEEIERGLRAREYETETRGARHQPAARAAGEGVYVILCPDRQMRLSYALELPERRGPVQEAFGIAAEGSFALSIKNPQAEDPAGGGLDPDRKADYPLEAQRRFGDRRFDVEHPDLLDHPGAEFVLSGATREPERDYGIKHPTEDENARSADALHRLRLDRRREPMAPMFRGVWE